MEATDIEDVVIAARHTAAECAGEPVLFPAFFFRADGPLSPFPIIQLA